MFEDRIISNKTYVSAAQKKWPFRPKQHK